MALYATGLGVEEIRNHAILQSANAIILFKCLFFVVSTHAILYGILPVMLRLGAAHPGVERPMVERILCSRIARKLEAINALAVDMRE